MSLKKEVDERLDKLESYISTEMDAIRKLASKKEVDLFSIKTYDDVVKALGEASTACPYRRIKQLEKLFNGTWKVNIRDNRQEKWYPWFNITGSGLVFGGSGCAPDYFYGQVGYFKDKKTSDHIGTYFKDIYESLHS